jgi:predicted ATPase
VLDNFEHVAPAAPRIAELLARCPSVRALVTSRVALRLRGEHEYALHPLALPDPQHLPPPEALTQYAAVALFIEQAQEAQADFQVTNATAPAVAEIYSRLDGLPLAIELAAARVKVLPPPALLKRLEHALPLLTGGAKDLDERQRTMRTTLAWSYDLLSHEERRLFRRLAVFAGGCDLPAAEAVCAAPEGAEPLGIDVLEGLTRLLDHSLVQQREEGGEPRFGMLHVVREFAAEQLEAVGPAGGRPEAEASRRAHFAAYLGVVEGTGHELGVWGPEPEAWFARFEREHDNYRAALAWARDRGEAELGLRLAGALAHSWDAGYLTEGRGWLEGLLALATRGPATGAERGRGRPSVSAAVRAKALCGAGFLAYFQGDEARAEAALEESLALAEGVDVGWANGLTPHILGLIAWDRGDLGLAAVRLREGGAQLRAAGAPGLAATNLTDQAHLATVMDDLDRAEALYAQSVALARQVGATGAEIEAVKVLAMIARKRGDLAQAERFDREYLAGSPVRAYPRVLPFSLEGLAQTWAAAGDEGRAVRAARLLGAAAALRVEMANPLQPSYQVDVDRAVAAARATLGEEAWAAAYAAGSVLSREEAIAEGLGEDEG